jgi:ABC-2 type transport system ATP-binding protein
LYLSRLSDIHRKEITRSRIEETLDIVGLTDVANRRVKTFSYGMKQRLGIAQTLLPRNKLVFLDEPTNGLDPHGIVSVRRLIKKISSELNITVFLSSHLLSEVEQVCDYVTIIDYGVKIRESKTTDLVAERNLIELLTTAVDLFEKYSDSKKITITSKNDAGNGQTQFLFEGSETDVPTLVADLVAAEIEIFSIKKHQNTLEEIFVELTGQNSNNSVTDRF